MSAGTGFICCVFWQNNNQVLKTSVQLLVCLTVLQNEKFFTP